MREKERRLEGRDLLLVGFTLFSMFFGAGNLIFPPNIAAQAGTQTWPAMLGLALSAVGLPVLGVVAVADTPKPPAPPPWRASRRWASTWSC